MCTPLSNTWWLGHKSVPHSAVSAGLTLLCNLALHTLYFLMLFDRLDILQNIPFFLRHVYVHLIHSSWDPRTCGVHTSVQRRIKHSTNCAMARGTVARDPWPGCILTSSLAYGITLFACCELMFCWVHSVYTWKNLSGGVLERGADLHTAQPMPLPLTVSCFSKIQIRFTFLVLAHPGSLGQRAVKRVRWSVATITVPTCNYD